MKLGLGSYSFMWAVGVEGNLPTRRMTAFDILDRCRELNIKAVQFGPNLPLDPQRIDDLAAAARDAGVEVELGMAGLEPDRIREHAALCNRFGATLLRTVDLYEGPPRSGAEIEAALRAALPIVEDHGVRLAVENARTPAGLLSAVLDAIGSSLLGITLDTVNSLAVPEGTGEVVRELARHTLCLHVKDFRVRRIWHMMGFTVEGAAAGQGQLDIPALLDALRAAGRDPNAILELWVPQQSTIEETIALEERWVRESIPYLRGLIKE